MKLPAISPYRRSFLIGMAVALTGLALAGSAAAQSRLYWTNNASGSIGTAKRDGGEVDEELIREHRRRQFVDRRGRARGRRASADQGIRNRQTGTGQIHFAVPAAGKLTVSGSGDKTAVRTQLTVTFEPQGGPVVQQQRRSDPVAPKVVGV